MLRILKSLTAFVRSRLVIRFYLTVLLVVGLPTVILFTTTLAVFERIVREAFDTEITASLQKAEHSVSLLLTDLVTVSEAVANDSLIARALSGDGPAFESTRLIDRAVEGIFSAARDRETLRYTLLTADGIYSNWGRNFNDYSFIRDLPLVSRARELNGHVVWDGFRPSFILEERHFASIISLARLFPTDTGERLGTLVLSVDRTAFMNLFRTPGTAADRATLIFDRDGNILMESGPGKLPREVVQAVASDAADASGTSRPAVIRKRVGGYFTASRRLGWLPEGIREQGWTISVIDSFSNISGRFARMRFLLGSAFTLLLFLAAVVSALVSRRLVQPVTALSRVVEAWTPQAGADPPHPDRPDEIGVLNRSFLRLEANVKDLFDRLAREHEVRERYRYRSLRAQLNPHFLFNTLNSIRWMAIIRKADNIVEALDALSGVLSYSIGKGGDFTTLEEELLNLEQYVRIQNIRYGGRFRLDREIPGEYLEAEILKFMLQPLVENSIMHGYRGASGEGRILVRAERGPARAGVGETLSVFVRDFGAAAEPARLSLALSGAGVSGENDDRSAGLGLSNIQEMIHISCGEACGISFTCPPDGGTEVRIDLPLRLRGANP